MKQKLLSTLVFLLVTFTAFSQPYVPLLENNPSYVYRVYSFGWNQAYNIAAPVNESIGIYTYKKFTDPFFGTDMYFREDVAAKKVYKIIDGTEVLFFNFSLPVGGYATLGNGFMYQVESITDVNVYGGTRRRFSLNNISNPFMSEVWIEGVGNPEHPLMAAYQLSSDPVYYLECSFTDGTNVFNRGYSDGGTPTDCSSLSVGQFSHRSVTLSPNPFDSQMIVSKGEHFDNASILLLNTLGKTIREYKNVSGNEFTINRDGLMAGMYFLQLTQNGRSITKKVIVAD